MSTSTGLRPYNDGSYRAARAWLTAHPDTVCHLEGCTAPATTIDHKPAIAQHQHIRGSGCCTLHPMCGPHNYGHGGRLVHQLRDGDVPVAW